MYTICLMCKVQSDVCVRFLDAAPRLLWHRAKVRFLFFAFRKIFKSLEKIRFDSNQNDGKFESIVKVIALFKMIQTGFEILKGRQ